MTTGFTITPLSRAHDRAAFTCGVPELDRYLRELVSQDIKRRVSNCFVALDAEGSIAAFYTLAACSLPLRELAAADAKRLPRYPVLPACLIGRLAVGERYKGRGLGAALLVDAVSRAARSDQAVFALVVDAKDDNAVSFYEHHGFQPFLSQAMRLFLPITEALRRLAAESGQS